LPRDLVCLAGVSDNDSVVRRSAGEAQKHKGRVSMININVLVPLLALIAGILILIMPKMLHYIVAVYLILYGIVSLGLLR
jgi:hypothetical protein